MCKFFFNFFERNIYSKKILPLRHHDSKEHEVFILFLNFLLKQGKYFSLCNFKLGGFVAEKTEVNE